MSLQLVLLGAETASKRLFAWHDGHKRKPINYSPHKRSFGGGGNVRGLDSVSPVKICARELASVVSRGLQAACRGLPWLPVDDQYIYIYIYIYSSKVSNTSLAPDNVKVFRP